MTLASIDFARKHVNEDTARLLLSAARYPAVDMPAAVQQIEGLRMAAEKWPSLLACEDYLYPPRLNREQASSEATACYKASLIAPHSSLTTVADLTGGMGIDSLALATVAGHVDYVERDPQLCTLMEHNCQALGTDNVSVHCGDSLEWLEHHDRFDLIFIDPARRDKGGRKVAAFEDCTPDLLLALPLLRSKGQRLLVKASPMIDITLALRQLGTVAEVHVVAVKGECKEVLFLCDSVHDGSAVVHCVNLSTLSIQNTPTTQNTLTFILSEEAAAEPRYCTAAGRYLYDPHAALRKAGCFRLLGQRYGLPLIGPGSHLYTSDLLVPDFPGRTFEVLREVKLNKKNIVEALPDGKAHVVVRHFPAEAAALQRQLGLREGGDLFIVATTVGTRRTAFLCSSPKIGEGDRR
ncbi:MAG: class I SAM-dependent methyltransferase [Bacteroidales bacterium]|nr:class I SAM-dependent methyltransferase [Bacteroidales bacterium]